MGDALPRVAFARESVAEVRAEVSVLMHLHWNEVGHYADLPLNPDFDRYLQLEQAGVLRIYTARLQRIPWKANLRGYAVYLVAPGLHYRHTLVAQQSTLYLHPALRKGLSGLKFIKWTERQLEAEGVELFLQHVKAKHSPRRAAAFCAMLQRQGYELQDYVLTRKVD